LHEDAQTPYGSASVRGLHDIIYITMVHHFANFMRSPQFTHPQKCKDDCKVEHENKNHQSKFEKILKRMMGK
jgi:hypothetical protein